MHVRFHYCPLGVFQLETEVAIGIELVQRILNSFHFIYLILLSSLPVPNLPRNMAESSSLSEKELDDVQQKLANRMVKSGEWQR